MNRPSKFGQWMRLHVVRLKNELRCAEYWKNWDADTCLVAQFRRTSLVEEDLLNRCVDPTRAE